MRRSAVAVLSLSLALSLAAPFGSEAATAGQLTVSFGPADGSGGIARSGSSEAVANLGSVTAHLADASARRARTTVVVRRVSVLVDGPQGVLFARLTARLASEDPRCRIQVDGVRLSATPRVLDANVRLGVARAHTLQVEVPFSESPGPFLSAIEWQAETE
jgi:hypothetical protein